MTFILKGDLKMKKIYKGIAFKEWFLKNYEVKRVLIPTRDSFHLVNLEEIDDNKYYFLSNRQYGEVIIEEVELIQ
mgnify:CR=1 FL=1